MGTLRCIALFFVFACSRVALTSGSEDAELKDPYLLEVARFAASKLLENADDLGFKNTSVLHRIMDANIVPYPQPAPTKYALTLELGEGCAGDGTCTGPRHICEVTIYDEKSSKRKMIDIEKTRCAEREPNTPLEFNEPSSTIATSLSLDDPKTKELANKAITQMSERRGGKHALIHIGKARKVAMEESNSNMYYWTLYISTNNDNTISEVCEVTMEESVETLDQTLQSLRCFATGENEGADKYGIARVPQEELTQSLIRHAVGASLAIIDAESTSPFQLKVVGHSLADSRRSLDSGTRDLELKLGVVPTLCIKQADSDDEDDDDKSCAIDAERDPSMCSITLTQWPWVTDGYLFSDFDCEPTNYGVISEELEAFADEDSSSSEEGAEVAEVASNAVQAPNRRDGAEEEDDEETEDEEDEAVDEEAFSKRLGPCLGCENDVNVESAEIKEMASFALEALEGAANTEKVQSVARVTKATSQVVSGMLYALTVELVDTRCLRGGNVERSACEPDNETGTRRICTVKIWHQPWLNSKKIQEPSCSTGPELESRSLKTVLPGHRENVTLSPDDEDVRNIANFALTRLDSFDDNAKKRILTGIVEASAHNVARSRTYNARIQVALVDCPESSSASDPACNPDDSSGAYFCDIQVLAQAVGDRFVPKRLIDSKCFPVAPKLGGEPSRVNLGNRRAPSPTLTAPKLGAPEASDKSSPYIQSVAKFATSAINERNNGNSLKLVRVLRAQTQVVAGKKVTLDVEVGVTKCAKGQNDNSANCQLDESQATVVCHVVVWDREWLGERRVTELSCDSLELSAASESPRPAAEQSQPVQAGIEQADSMSEQIEADAEFSLAVVEEQSNSENKLKVTKILASSVQIAEGRNVRLTLEIADTRCKKDEESDDCPVDPDAPHQICNINIWEKHQEKQVTDLNCQPKRFKPYRTGKSEDMDESPFVGEAPASFRLGGDPADEVPKQKPKKNKLKNQLRRTGAKQRSLPLLGAYSPADVNDTTVIEMANFAASLISQSYTSNLSVINNSPVFESVTEPFKLVKILSAQKQVVSGVNYKLELELNRQDQTLICRVVVFDQPWTSTREVTSSTCFPFSFATSEQKPAGPTAAFKPIDLNDPVVERVASYAIDELSKAGEPVSLVKVNSAARQTVEDHVSFKLSIQTIKSGATQVCGVVVDGASDFKLSSSACGDTSSKRRRQVDGGYNKADVNDPDVKEMANFAATAIEAATNSKFAPGVTVVSAETQVVSGRNYRLVIKLGSDTTCNVVVYDQSWTKTRKLSGYDCKDSKGRTARQQQVRIRRPPPSLAVPSRADTELSIQPPSHCIGGYCPVDPNEKAVREMANFATISLSRTLNAGALSLIKIRSAERQVVAGFNYRMDLEFNGSGGVVKCNVIVFDQAWTATRQISSSQCEPATVAIEPVPVRPERFQPVAPPRRVVGSYQPLDPEDSSVKEMALFATSTIQASSNSKSLEIIRVVSASRQVVSGLNFKLTIELSDELGTQTCEVVVYDQSWTQTRKLTSSNCVRPEQPGEPDEPEDLPTNEPHTELDVDDENVKELAEFATKMMGVIRNNEELSLLEILAASKQSDDEANHRLTLRIQSAEETGLSCEVVVYDKQNARQLLFSSCSPATRRRRSTGDVMTGGVSPIDVKSPKIKELADFAASAIALRSNEPNAPESVRVIKATKQVVSGMMYNLDMELTFTVCPQDDESCKRIQRCSVSIWEQPWLQKRDISKLKCSDVSPDNQESTLKQARPSMANRRLLGGLVAADPNSQDVQVHAQFALQAIQAQSNAKRKLKVVRVKKAATQTVGGKKYYLTIELGETKCQTDEQNEDCPFDYTADRQICKVVIFARPWLNEKQITDLKCATMRAARATQLRSRRSVTEAPHHKHHRHHHRHKKVRYMKHMTAFRAYLQTFNKFYQTWSEFERRFKIYRANQEKIELLNRLEMGTAEYGDTPFSDWSEEEYKTHLVGLNAGLRASAEKLPKAKIPQVSLPNSFDWRDHNAVTPVKNQGQCGSCWAFSTTGNIEGLYSVRHGELISLSEQELVDCDKLDSGCNGGLMENAYKAIQDLGGLETESDYPYNGHQNSCKLNKNITQVQVTGGVEISKNETEMAQWLIENGPISIGINANGMQFYRGGVSHPWKAMCRAGGIDHGVLIVGFGVSDYPKFKKTLPYWIVKNSWGTRWGEQGYYRVYRGDGTCGLNEMATSAVIE